MKFKGTRLAFTDPEGDRLTADVYQSDGTPSSGFLILNVSSRGYSHSVRLSREEARKFAKAIRKQVKQR